MKVRMCPQTWMAEAIEDGRLRDADKAAFGRHAAGCQSCTRAVADLELVRVAMSRLPEDTLTDFETRRQRMALLAKAYERQGRREPATRLRWGLAAVSAMAVVLVLSVPAVRRRSPVVPGDVALATPAAVQITNIRGASWVTETHGDMTRVVLQRGLAEFHVPPLRGGQRILVGLPDGELEVHGTRFLVEIAGWRTRSVIVTEGRVSFRRIGEPERSLSAGTRFDDREEPKTTAPTDHLAAAAPESSPAVVPTRRVPARHRAWTPTRPERAEKEVELARPAASASQGAPAAVAVVPTAPAVAPAPPPASPSSEVRAPEANAFALAVRAFQAGDYGRADVLLERFVREHREDPRSEDAAFLRALARRRSGDARGAAVLARAYLQQYPAGMRRREAESLIERTAP